MFNVLKFMISSIESTVSLARTVVCILVFCIGFIAIFYKDKMGIFNTLINIVEETRLVIIHKLVCLMQKLIDDYYLAKLVINLIFMALCLYGVEYLCYHLIR